MSLPSRLREVFDSGEEPGRNFVDSVLGAMSWNEDYEAWIGEYNGFRFALPYERNREPASAFLENARETLTNPRSEAIAE